MCISIHSGSQCHSLEFCYVHFRRLSLLTGRQWRRPNHPCSLVACFLQRVRGGEPHFHAPVTRVLQGTWVPQRRSNRTLGCESHLSDHCVLLRTALWWKAAENNNVSSWLLQRWPPDKITLTVGFGTPVFRFLRAGELKFCPVRVGLWLLPAFGHTEISAPDSVRWQLHSRLWWKWERFAFSLPHACCPLCTDHQS